MTKVEQYEAIRRDKCLRGKSIRKIAKDHGVHRRTVRQALESAVPPVKRKPVRLAPVLTLAAQELIDGWLLGDRVAPRKQRHTARRIWQRLRAEEGFVGAESTVRRYVGRRRRELGAGKEVFVPLIHAPGQESEVDWYEADVSFPWGQERVQFFEMRSCFSGREFHMAFPRQTQQAFLEAHVAAFAYFGGVFTTSRYDNLKAAVKRVLRGRRREESDRFVALRSHYLFDSEFCQPGVKGAHEKGGVEGGVGRFRRTHLVPVPVVQDYAELNRRLLDACAQDDQRRMEGRSQTIMEDFERERGRLQSLPREPFATAEVSTAAVDSKGTLRVRTNRYSVPVRLAHRRVEYRLHATRLDVVHEGKVVARHPRLQGRHGLRVELDHYVELLWHKPGALERSLPLHQARARGEWPVEYDRLYMGLRERFENAEAARQMLAVMMLHREAPTEEVHVAVGLALEHGCYDAGAIGVLLRQQRATDDSIEPLQGLGVLQRYDRPVMGTTDYDQLLSRAATQAVH